MIHQIILIVALIWIKICFCWNWLVTWTDISSLMIVRYESFNQLMKRYNILWNFSIFSLHPHAKGLGVLTTSDNENNKWTKRYRIFQNFIFMLRPGVPTTLSYIIHDLSIKTYTNFIGENKHLFCCRQF